MSISQFMLLAFAGLIVQSAADITLSVSDVEWLSLDPAGSINSSFDLFRQSCPEEFSDGKPAAPEILLSSSVDFTSFDDDGDTFPRVFPSSGSFIRGALEAWARHQHLVLRPDEVWFEILAQLNFYMTRHAEDLRDLFVDHVEKETVQVRGISWDDMVAAFSTEIQKRIKTDWLREWIMPGFSTSTQNDELTASVLMMGLMQQFFDYEGIMICGLPKVTLLGERKDWVRLLEKLDQLKKWGKEPEEYAKNLKPILTRFVKTWDEPENPEVKAFWNQIVRANRYRGWDCGGGDGPYEYRISGWITGFLHWRKEGILRVLPVEDYDYYDDDGDDDEGNQNEEDEDISEDIEVPIDCPNCVTLDNTTYIPENLDSIPIGYAKAPVKMVDYPIPGAKTEAYLLAGNIGVKREELNGEVMARPLSGWVLYAPVNWSRDTGPWFGNGDEVRRIADGMEFCQGLDMVVQR